MGGFAAIFEAIARAAGSSSPGGTTWDTSPIRSASCASITSPVKSNSAAFEDGRCRGRRAWPYVAQALCRLIALLAEHDLLHVVARAEGPPGPGHDDAPHLRVTMGITKGLLELRVEAPRQRVHRLPPVQRHRRGMMLDFVE